MTVTGLTHGNHDTIAYLLNESMPKNQTVSGEIILASDAPAANVESDEDFDTTPIVHGWKQWYRYSITVKDPSFSGIPTALFTMIQDACVPGEPAVVYNINSEGKITQKIVTRKNEKERVVQGGLFFSKQTLGVVLEILKRYGIVKPVLDARLSSALPKLCLDVVGIINEYRGTPHYTWEFKPKST